MNTMRPKRLASMLAAILGLWVAACTEPPRADVANPVGPAESEATGVEALAAFMGTLEEREARAPYSPVGWPLKPGDLVTSREWGSHLARHFPGWRDVEASYWVGPRVFGAVFRVDSEAWRAAREEDPLADMMLRYYGHARQKTSWEWEHASWLDPLPSHLQREDPEKLKRALYAPGGWAQSADTRLAEIEYTWTRENWLEGYVGESNWATPSEGVQRR